MAARTSAFPQRSVLVLAYLCCYALALVVQYARASDADPLQDFCVADGGTAVTFNGLTCKPIAQVQSSDFKSSLLQNAGTLDAGLGVAVNLASAANFGALNTQGLSIARIDFQPKGLNPPHVHPRATEVLFLAEGTLLVGFVTATPGNNTLFQQKLSAGDLFVFPRGLVHFQFNPDKTKSALAISGLNSQNPGVSQLAAALFAAQPPLPDQVLETTFGIEDSEVKSLVASVAKTLV